MMILNNPGQKADPMISAATKVSVETAAMKREPDFAIPVKNRE
jgi:hypothetical protein